MTLVSRNAGIAVHDEGDDGQRERMGEHGAVAALALRKIAQELDNARPEINRQAEDRAQLDDDGEHLPVAVGQIDAAETLRQCAGARSS